MKVMSLVMELEIIETANNPLSSEQNSILTGCIVSLSGTPNLIIILFPVHILRVLQVIIFRGFSSSRLLQSPNKCPQGPSGLIFLELGPEGRA